MAQVETKLVLALLRKKEREGGGTIVYVFNNSS